MKLVRRTFVMAGLAMLLAAPAGAQGSMTLAGDMQGAWEALTEQIVNAADAMPAEKFSYKSTPAQRDFGAQVMHIVEVNQMLLGTLGGKTQPPMINLKATAKADIINALKQSFDYGAAVIKEFNDQQLAARVTPPRFLGPSASRVSLIAFALQHTQDIYGQMVVYLRLNDIVPPASRRGGV
jgi:uncharacterized damage-inducible protein DinB